MANKYRIRLFNNISDVGLRLFPESKYSISDDFENPDAVLVRSHRLHNYKIGPSLKAVARAGAGTNNIPVNVMSTNGIPVFNAPGANANAVKELVLATILITARNILPAFNFVNGLSDEGEDLQRKVEKAKKEFGGFELPGKKLGIIGLGKIGSLVAKAGVKLGMKVVGYDPSITVASAWGLSTEIKRAETLDELIEDADYISVHVPLIDETRKLLNRRILQGLKPSACVLNFSRGGIVDDQDIIKMLLEDKLRHYVTDFPNHKLRGVPGVIALPHIGASTIEAEEYCAEMVVNQVRDFLENGNISNSVNFPDVSMGRESAFRLGISNRNVPNMVGQISTCLAKDGLNIHNMVNKSLRELAYTLVDVDSAVDASMIESIGSIEGVLGIRYIPDSTL